MRLKTKIKSFAIFQIILAVILIPLSIYTIGNITLYMNLEGINATLVLYGSIVNLIINSLGAVAAVGLLLSQKWGRYTEIALGWLVVAYFIGSLLVTGDLPNPSLVVYAIIVLWFFNRSKIIKYFK